MVYCIFGARTLHKWYRTLIKAFIKLHITIYLPCNGYSDIGHRSLFSFTRYAHFYRKSHRLVIWNIWQIFQTKTVFKHPIFLLNKVISTNDSFKWYKLSIRLIFVFFLPNISMKLPPREKQTERDSKKNKE